MTILSPARAYDVFSRSRDTGALKVVISHHS
jgi:hypothetical protein